MEENIPTAEQIAERTKRGNQVRAELQYPVNAIAEVLRKYYNPHCTVIITDSWAKVVQDDLGFPVEKGQPED